ncbi:hypothetical protein Tco_0775427 [Tanacetum coccineum]
MILTTNTPYPSRKIRRIRACTHQKTTKETNSIRRIQRSPIRRIQDIVCEDSRRYQTWSLLQETPIRRIQSIGYADDDSKEDQEEDGDDRDTFNMIEDVERIRQIFNVLDEISKIVQPLIPEPIHTTPHIDDYVAPATKSILDELLEEFGEEILNVTMVDKEDDFNPTKDLEELERLLAKDPQLNFTEIQIGTLYLLEEVDLEHGLEHAVSSSYHRANPGE